MILNLNLLPPSIHEFEGLFRVIIDNYISFLWKNTIRKEIIYNIYKEQSEIDIGVYHYTKPLKTFHFFALIIFHY